MQGRYNGMSNTKYNRIYIGIDQSYQNTGVSIAADGKLKDIKSIRLDRYKHNSDKRKALGDYLNGLLTVVTPASTQITTICERARLHGGPTSFINIDAIKAMGALTATIVDICHTYNIQVYSVDTRCWKSQVVGTSKGAPNNYGVPEEKWPTVRWTIEQGFEDKILLDVSNTRKHKGTFVRNGIRYMYNNDAADSAGIAMFGFVGDKGKLYLER